MVTNLGESSEPIVNIEYSSKHFVKVDKRDNERMDFYFLTLVVFAGRIKTLIIAGEHW